jgi:uncharacterized protein (TIGR00369 family)
MAKKTVKKAKDGSKEHTQAAQGRLKANPATNLLGFELESVSPGRAVLRMGVQTQHRQMQGVVHGGILAALADTAGAIAAFTTVPPGTAIATVELKINYLEAVVDGNVTAEARVLRAGRNFVVAECEIFDEEKALAAKAIMTFGAAGGHTLGEVASGGERQIPQRAIGQDQNTKATRAPFKIGPWRGSE